MARFARLNDPDPFVRARLQAALYINRKRRRARTETLSSESQQFFSRLPAPLSPDLKDYYSQFIDGLVADGIWEIGDALWVTAAPDSPTARINLLKDSALLLPVSSPVFTPFKGYKGNGVSSYVDTQFNLATDSVNFTRNSASIGVWNLASHAAIPKATYGASDGATKNTHGFLLYSGITSYFRLNGPEGAGINNASTISNGFFLSNRSGVTTHEVYRDGLSMGIYPGTTSTDPVSLNMFLLCNNVNGSPSSFIADEISIFWIGGSMDATKVANFHARAATFLTQIGAI